MKRDQWRLRFRTLFGNLGRYEFFHGVLYSQVFCFILFSSFFSVNNTPVSNQVGDFGEEFHSRQFQSDTICDIEGWIVHNLFTCVCILIMSQKYVHLGKYWAIACNRKKAWNPVQLILSQHFLLKCFSTSCKIVKKF